MKRAAKKTGEKTMGGIHAFLAKKILPRYPSAQVKKAVDLGAWSGAFAVQLKNAGYDVLAVDRDKGMYEADLPFTATDLNDPDFACKISKGAGFDMVTAIEIIEHLESPIGFLRNIERLLKPDGVAVITTPNMDNVPARLRHLLTGKLHMMDERVPRHITPIFHDLFTRVYLDKAGLELVEHHLCPERGFGVSSQARALIYRLVAAVLPGENLYGDAHVFVVKRKL
jgi:2-polyprenyl-3-methyl-5-hydroxy-6-metoxy-1,4-benzoquinol methylase